MMDDNRLIELEIKAAYQDDLLQDLNKIVSQQQHKISQLEATCKMLHERIKSLSTEGGHSNEVIDETPPHY
jgi:SlyX protein